LFPAYVACILLVAQAFIAVWRLQRIRALFGLQDASVNAPAGPTPATQAQGFFDEAKQHIQSQGVTVILFRGLRLLGTLTLVGLTTAAFLILEDDAQTSVTGIHASGKWGKGHRSKRRRGPNEVIFTRDEWIEVIYLALYVCGTS